jgi:hypothetical protein
LTNRGREYVSWLEENGYKSVFLTSDMGGWGTDPEIGE